MPRRYPVIPGAEPWSSAGEGERGKVGVAVVHGFTGNPNSTRPLGEAIAREGYTVEVVRLPGHGTHWRDMARTRYRDWRRAVERVVDDLGERCDHVVLIGFSIGATLALDVAADRPTAVSALVCVNTTILDRDDPIAKVAGVLQYVLPVVPSTLAGIKKNDVAKEGGDEKAYAYTPAKTGYSVVKELPGLRDRLAKVTMPVLVAYSRQDHTAPMKNSQALLKLLGSDDVTELVFERSYHLVTLDHDADLLVDEATKFIQRVTNT